MPKRGREKELQGLCNRVAELQKQVIDLDKTVRKLQRDVLEQIAKKARGEREASLKFCEEKLMSLLAEERAAEARQLDTESDESSVVDVAGLLRLEEEAGNAGDLVPIAAIVNLDDNIWGE